MKKHLSTIILVLLMLTGICLMLYPSASDYWNSLHQSRAIAGYVEDVAELDTAQNEEMWKAAADYNETLARKGIHWGLTEEEEQLYESLLDVTGTGIMGYIDIPKIRVSLPIYHGTDEAVLQIAIGHLEGSSLPVGGVSSHCVISGHRGLPSAKLFTDLDEMETGDRFLLHVLNETLTYEVDQIRIVEPEDMENLVIEEGQDYCTLVTCTPYGVNSHRLLVRGHRAEGEREEVRVSPDARMIDPLTVAPMVAVPVLILLFIWLWAGTAGKRREKEMNGNEISEKK